MGRTSPSGELPAAIQGDERKFAPWHAAPHPPHVERFSSTPKATMAESTSVLVPPAVPAAEDLKRVEKFTLEPFVHEGEDPAIVLAAGTPRRRALDEALAEMDAGLTEPSVTWRQHYSLMLGLERLVAQDEPKLVDGTVLNAHQVDALSGTLIALLAEAQSGNGNGSRNGAAPADVEELPSGEVELEGDDELGDDDEPLDWQDSAEGDDEPGAGE